MKYERLTRKDERGFYHYNCTEKDQEDCVIYENCGECYGTQVLYRLAELEDKIEQGKLKEEKTCIFEEWQDTLVETSVWCCSNCKEDFYFMEGGAKENMYRYCPNCGARISEYKELQE